MTDQILITPTTVVIAGSTRKLLPGDPVNSAVVQAAVTAAGGLMAPAALPSVAAAAVVAQRYKAKGGNEELLATLMLGAYIQGNAAAVPGNSSIIFNPDGEAGGNVYTTAASVAEALIAVNGAASVYLVGNCTLPAGVTWAFNHLGSIVANYGYTTLEIQDGAQITGLLEATNTNFLCDCQTVHSFAFDDVGEFPILSLYNSNVTGNAGSTIAPFGVPNYLGLAMYDSSTLTTVSGSVPMFAPAANATIVIQFFYGDIDGAFSLNLVGTASGASFYYDGDASAYPIPAFTGTAASDNGSTDNAYGVLYTPTTSANFVTQPANVQQGLDYLAAQTKLFTLNVTLTSGTATVASGKDLTNAKVVSVYLTAATTAVGVPEVTFVAGADGNVTVTSKSPLAATLTTDASTYTVVFAGAV